jgi:hypothetical protein
MVHSFLSEVEILDWYSEILTEIEIDNYTNMFLKYDEDDSGRLDRYVRFYFY